MAGRTVHVTVGGAGHESLASGPLSGENQVVELDLPVGRSRADDEGAADLAPVSAVVGAEADGEKISFLHPSVRGPVAAPARVGSGGDGGREGGAVGSVVDQPAFQFEREMPLRAADQDRFEEFTQRLVGDLGGDPQTADLLLVLHDAQLLDGRAEIGQPELRGDRGHGPVPGDRQIVFLDGQGLRPACGGQIRGGHDGITAGHRQQVHPELIVGAPVGRITGRGARAEQDVLVGAEQQHGTRGRSARQVADIGGAGDQGGRGSDCGAPVAEQPAADGVHL